MNKLNRVVAPLFIAISLILAITLIFLTNRFDDKIQDKDIAIQKAENAAQIYKEELATERSEAYAIYDEMWKLRATLESTNALIVETREQ